MNTFTVVHCKGYGVSNSAAVCDILDDVWTVVQEGNTLQHMY